MRARTEAIERFNRYVKRGGDDECWPWTGGIGSWGYGGFWLEGKTINAQRAAWLLSCGDIPSGLVVCHRCDNPSCVNVKHLFLGTQGDNVRDCNDKGRAKGTFRKADHPKHTAKMTPEMVREARKLYAAGVSQSEIGRRFHIHSSVISRAVRGLTWADA